MTESSRGAAAARPPFPDRGAPLPRHVRFWMRMSRRNLRDLPPPRCGVRVDAGLVLPAADGVPLITDHYIPQLDGPRPTVLVRTPYGRSFPWDHLFGGLIAERGFHVVIQSCRGTGGSGGQYEPFRHERADGQATVAWLREQPWFTGELATIGPSYLGYVQFALAAQQPPELRAMVVQAAMSGPYPFVWPGGCLRAGERAGRDRRDAGLRARDGRGDPGRAAGAAPHAAGQPGTAADPRIPAGPGRPGALAGGMADPPGPGRPVLGRPADPPGAMAAVPVSLLTGWWDACLDPVLEEYGRLRAAGHPVRLVIGPWTHSSAFSKALPCRPGRGAELAAGLHR